jgi:hypothetical protein
VGGLGGVGGGGGGGGGLGYFDSTTPAGANYASSNYMGTPGIIPYQENFSTDPNIASLFNTPSSYTGGDADQWIGERMQGGANPNLIGGRNVVGSGGTAEMNEALGALGTLNVDNAAFYQGLKPAADFASFAAANGLPATGGSGGWAMNLYNNYIKHVQGTGNANNASNPALVAANQANQNQALKPTVTQNANGGNGGQGGNNKGGGGKGGGGKKR